MDFKQSRVLTGVPFSKVVSGPRDEELADIGQTAYNSNGVSVDKEA